jgi:hypothetical protein
MAMCQYFIFCTRETGMARPASMTQLHALALKSQFVIAVSISFSPSSRRHVRLVAFRWLWCSIQKHQ